MQQGFGLKATALFFGWVSNSPAPARGEAMEILFVIAIVALPILSPFIILAAAALMR